MLYIVIYVHMGNDKYASCVGGVTGDSNIAEMWKNHYANLYNSVNDGGSRERFYDRIGIIWMFVIASHL